MLGPRGGLGNKPSPTDAHDAGPVSGPWQDPTADAHDAGAVCGPWQDPVQLMLTMLCPLGRLSKHSSGGCS